METWESEYAPALSIQFSCDEKRVRDDDNNNI